MSTSLLPEKNETPDAPEEHHDELAQIAERVIEIPQPDTPRLEIHREGCQVAIHWQAAEEKFRLEISEHAYTHGDWQRTEETAQVAGGIHRVLLPGAAFVRYVRLARNRPARRSAVIPASKATFRPAVRKTHGKHSHTATTAVRTEGIELIPLLLVLATAALFMVRHLAAGQ